jgi:cytidylate kinase
MDEQYVVTISHQLGSGGAYVGMKLSKLLSIPFVDREILKKVADYLNLPEEEIENREERLASFWQNLSRMESLSDPIMGAGVEYSPSDKELYNLESEFIQEIAKKSSAIILGRGGRFILRDFPRHLSVFVCADLKDRIGRVSELYHIPENTSRKMIEKNDRERNAYIKSFTGLEWLDPRSYDICINTSSIGLDNAVTVIKNSLEFKLKF